MCNNYQDTVLILMYYNSVRDDIDNDLRLMPRYAIGYQNSPVQLKLRGNQAWRQLFGKLAHYWQNTRYPASKNYQPLANLFSELNSPEMTAFFFHVGYGWVSKNIFKLLANRRNYQYAFVYGLHVQRELGLLEKTVLITHHIGRSIVPFYVGIPLAILVMILGFFFGTISFEIPSEIRSPQNKLEDPEPPSLP